MRRGKYEKGSALIWAMMFMLIISILITSGLSIGLSFVGRSAVQKQEQQAYYTARSVLKGMADWLQTARLEQASPLEGGAQTLSAHGDAAVFIRDELSASILQTIPGLPEDMGGCEVSIEGDMHSDITLTVRAELGNALYAARCYLSRVTEFIPGTPAFIPPEPPPGNPPLPPEREALPPLAELEPADILHGGIQLDEASVDEGLSYLYPLELKRSVENILVIDDGAEAVNKALTFRFSGDHSPRFPPTVILNPALAQEPGGEADEAELDESALGDGAEPASTQTDELAPRYDTHPRIAALEGNYRSFRFYTGEGFASPLTLGPLKGPQGDRGNRVYYTNASFVIEQGARFRMAARAGLRGGEISTYIPTSISGVLERGSWLTVNADVTTFEQEEYDAILSSDGYARTDYANNPRAYAPGLSEDSAILVKSGAVLRIIAGEFLGNIYVEAGGRLELEGAPVISGGIYLYAPEEMHSAPAQGEAEALPPAELVGVSEGLSATIYAHPDALIDPLTLEAGGITLITKYFLGEEPEEATPGTPDITIITWADPVFTEVS